MALTAICMKLSIASKTNSNSISANILLVKSFCLRLKFLRGIMHKAKLPTAEVFPLRLCHV